MQRKKLVFFIVGGIILLLVIYLVTTYNSLIKKEEKVKQAWSQVQSTYQRRLDLVPNLVNVVKGVSEFESGTLEDIARARSRALETRTDDVSAENYNKQKSTQDTLAAATNRLILVIEKYPVLKGTAAYRGLQTQLVGTERRIKVARTDFNAAVADYNTTVRSSGAGPVAGLFGFKVKDGFQADAGAEKSVEIKF